MTQKQSASAPAQDHGHGLGDDLARIAALQFGRRRALLLLGGVGGAALLSGCGEGSSSDAVVSTSASATPTPSPTPTPTATSTPTPSSGCTVPASETNGPYPADGTNTAPGVTSNALTYSGVVRSDVRSSFAGSSRTVASGVTLEITVTLVDANHSCAPLAGYAVYMWHCDKDGAYSLYSLPNESYLRGVQVSDASGQVKFTTVFPGCYSGRWPHIHFEVFSSLANTTSGRYAVLISQFAMPATQCAAVYATSAYASSMSNYRNISIASDNVFGDNSSAQMAVMTPSFSGDTTNGYQATATIGIAT